MLHSKETTLEKLCNPSVGDRFTEMYSYYMWVVKITEGFIYYTDTVGMEKKYRKRLNIKNIPKIRGEVPIDLQMYRLTKHEFLQHFKYGSIEGSWVTYIENQDVEGWFDVLLDTLTLPSSLSSSQV